MDLHQLRCFVAAAEELHFGKAARRLDMLPSALGRYVQLLEKKLGARLMSRTTRRVELTDDGVFLLERARSLLNSADDLESQIRKRARSKPCSSASAQSTVPQPVCYRAFCATFESAGRTSRCSWSRTKRSGYCRCFWLAVST